MVNVPLLLETMEHIKNNPQTWRQQAWYSFVDEEGNAKYVNFDVDVEEVNSCNTAFCFAGHAALKAGFPSPPKYSTPLWCANIDGVTMSVDGFAVRELGITEEQADVLFEGENSMEDLEKIVQAIIDNPYIDGDELEEMLGRSQDDCPCGCMDEDY